MRILRGCAALGLLLVVMGCGNQTDTPLARPDTGATAVVRAYFEALAHKDWASAYAMIDAGSKPVGGEAEFARLAEQYHKDLGFAPTEVRVQSCDERGDEAVAHVTMKGRQGSSQRYRKDSVSLRKRGSTWTVVLPNNFGKARPAKK